MPIINVVHLLKRLPPFLSELGEHVMPNLGTILEIGRENVAFFFYLVWGIDSHDGLVGTRRRV
jgi:hypothetical protein